jgi:hypothetical protein
LILGTNNIESTKELFNKALGFNIKKGGLHKNGIENLFIEFKDGSEIEIMTIDTPRDMLAKEYKTLINQKKWGLGFAFRTDQIEGLAQHLNNVYPEPMELIQRDYYTTLSRKKYDKELPLFFIEYQDKNSNSIIDHPNCSVGINSIWLSTKDLRETVLRFSDWGFSLIDTIKIPDINNKAILVRNNNFEVILIEGDKYEISGVSIKTSCIEKLKRRLENSDVPANEYRSKRGKNILLNPGITKSIWIEFTD